MIPRFKPALGLNEILAAFSCPKKDDVKRFEQDFADLMGQKYALAFPYGRTGLMLLLEALGLQNKEIICPAYTCVVVPHAILFSKNIPVFIDCAEGDFNMDLVKAEGAINKNTGAIIATSIFGYPVNLDRLDKIRKKYPHIRIIQDCAHSFAAEWNGRPVQKEGIAAVFGLNISKLLTSIFGGMITTDDELLYQNLKQLRDTRLKKSTFKKSLKRFIYLLAVYPAFWEPIYRIINKFERLGFLDRFGKYYNEAVIDMPEDYLEGLTNLEARVGQTQILKYRKMVKSRQQYAIQYIEQCNNQEILFQNFSMGNTYSQIVALVKKDRARFIKSCQRKKIEIGIVLEYAIPEMPAYLSQQGFENSGYYSRHIINLPVSGRYKPKNIDTVINGINSLSIEQ